jgi:hypothetical protein
MRIILLICCWCSLIVVHAQERAMLHLDKPFYATGETIGFRLYLPAQGAKPKMSIHATLTNAKATLVQDHFFRIDDTAGAGSAFTIPLEWPSDLYYLVCTATDLSLSEAEIIQIPIPIVNDLQAFPATSNTESNDAPLDNVLGHELQSLRVSIQPLTKSPLISGQNTYVQISVSDLNGQPVAATGSVSITDLDLIGASNTLHTGTTLKLGHDWQTDIYRHGQLLDVFSQPKILPLLAAGDWHSGHISFSKTDDKGDFSLKIDDYEGQRPIQILDVDGGEIQVKWKKPVVRSQVFRLSTTMREYAYWSRQRRLIAQVFPVSDHQVKAQSLIAPHFDIAQWPTRRSYNVQDYQAFPDMATFFSEVTQLVKFTPAKGTYKVQMYDLEQGRNYNTSPLFILDGRATFDVQFIAQLSPVGIQSVDVLYGLKPLRKYFPAIGGGGIIYIRSLSGHRTLPEAAEEDIFSLAGFVSNKSLATTASASSGPIFKPLLLWDPMLRTDSQGKATLSFTGSDDRSRYRVQVVVQSKDGRRGAATYTFEMK